jgi:hypothetical protein
MKYVGTKAAGRSEWFGLTTGVNKRKAVRGSTAWNEGRSEATCVVGVNGPTSTRMVRGRTRVAWMGAALDLYAQIAERHGGRERVR